MLASNKRAKWAVEMRSGLSSKLVRGFYFNRPNTIDQRSICRPPLGPRDFLRDLDVDEPDFLPGVVLRNCFPPTYAPLNAVAAAVLNHTLTRGKGAALAQRCKTLGVHPRLEAAISKAMALHIREELVWMLLARYVVSRRSNSDPADVRVLNLSLRMSELNSREMKAVARVFRQELALYPNNTWRPLTLAQRATRAARSFWSRIWNAW